MNIKVCTPLYRVDGTHSKMRTGVAALGMRWETCTGPHIWRNRNNLVDGKWDHYLFWDADISTPSPHSTVMSLLHRGVDIVGAAYEKRRDDGQQSYCAGVDDRGHLAMTSTGLHEVDWVGAGFLLVRGGVFRALPKPWFRHEFVGDDQTPEDIGFCMNARRHGFSVYVDCDVVVQHHL